MTDKEQLRKLLADCHNLFAEVIPRIFTYKVPSKGEEIAECARKLKGRIDAALAAQAEPDLSAANVTLANESARLYGVIDNLVRAADGLDSLDAMDEEYGPALEAFEKALAEARPFTEKAMLAQASAGPDPLTIEGMIASERKRNEPAAQEAKHAHSKSEYKRLTTLGVNILPPKEPAPSQVKSEPEKVAEPVALQAGQPVGNAAPAELDINAIESAATNAMGPYIRWKERSRVVGDDLALDALYKIITPAIVLQLVYRIEKAERAPTESDA